MRGDQLARQWQLLQHLARSRAGLDLDTLAEELGCVRRTVYRDLDALMYAGFPVISERRDGRVYWRFLETFQLGDVPFTPDEILALAFGEDLLRVLEGTVFHDSVQSALAKIRAGLSAELTAYLERLRESFRVLPGPHKRYTEYSDTIAALNAAVLGKRTVRMRYRTGRTGKRSSRRFDPYKVWYRGGGLYVIGLDHQSGEIRTFAVDRIQKLEATDDAFEIQEGFDFDAWTAASFGVVAEPALPVRIRFAARHASWISERSWHPSQALTPLPDGGVELCMEAGGSEELASWVMSFGGGAEMLEPESLRRRVAKELRAALGRYEGAGAQRPKRKGAAPKRGPSSSRARSRA
jgi:predicted DNA-binding transcriptional regulator YafY